MSTPKRTPAEQREYEVDCQLRGAYGMVEQHCTCGAENNCAACHWFHLCRDTALGAYDEGARLEFERLSVWLDHRWKCAITRVLRSDEPPPRPYPPCDCGFDEHVLPQYKTMLARQRGEKA